MGAKVIVGVNEMTEVTSPPLTTGMIVVVPSMFVVTLMIAGGLVTAPGTSVPLALVDAERETEVIPVPGGTDDELTPVPRGADVELEPVPSKLELDELSPVSSGAEVELTPVPEETEVESTVPLVDEELVLTPAGVEVLMPVPIEFEDELMLLSGGTTVASVADVLEPVPNGTEVEIPVPVPDKLVMDVDELALEEEVWGKAVVELLP